MYDFKGFFIYKLMFYVYIIYSQASDKYYVGSCENIEKRLSDHLNSRSNYTKMAKDWELKHSEEFLSRAEAVCRELQIKNKKSRKYIEFLISTNE